MRHGPSPVCANNRSALSHLTERGKATDTKEQLELVGKLVDTLTAELGRLKDNQATRAELIAQIIRLGTLYQSVKSGDDLLLQDR